MEYLLKASAVIFIFYTCYKLFLQRETFFEYNRWFLIIGIITAVLIPLIVIPVYIEYVPVVQNFIIANDEPITQTTIDNTFNFTQLFYLVYSLGAIFFLIKIITEFTSLLLLLKKNTAYKRGGYSYIETNQNIPPFSFFNAIVYNKNQFNHLELELIINHEKIHANQFHSLDILLIQIASALFWFNPFVWLYRKEMQQNLEFIADKEAQNVSNCEKSYQTLLLKSSVPNYQLVLANNFYNSLIKKRIVMLHKSKSNKLNVWKYALILPVLGIFLMSVNTKNIYVEKAIATKKNASIADPSVENKLNPIIYSSVNNETNSNKGQDPKVKEVIINHEMVMITKDFSDGNIDDLKNQLKEKGISIKFKGIKRNSKNEITAIKIEVSSKTSNANYNTESEEPISPIKIGFDSDGSKLSIGNSEAAPSSDHSFTFMSKDGNHKIHTVGSADNIFVIAGDDTDEKVEKIVIRKVDKVHVGPKSKSNVKFISKDSNVTEINDENVVVWESQKGNIDTIHVKKMSKESAVWVGKEHEGNLFKVKENTIIAGAGDTDTLIVKKLNKGKAIWVNKTDSENVYAFENGEDNKFFISTGNGEAPLYILNGKEISKEEMDAIKPDSIEKVEVLKGESATKKYGDKGENGVILITTKDKK